MKSRKPVEWYKEVDGLEDNSPMETNQTGDVYQMESVGPESLDDWKDTIYLEAGQADWLSE
jgi:hypothetical protein